MSLANQAKDRRVIACNPIEDTSAYARGELAYVMQLSQDRVRVLVRSRGTRWVEVWVKIARLANFRFKTIPHQHPLYEHVGEVGEPQFFTNENLTNLARQGAGQQVDLR